jgi:hypothetical protein
MGRIRVTKQASSVISVKDKWRHPYSIRREDVHAITPDDDDSLRVELIGKPDVILWASQADKFMRWWER